MSRFEMFPQANALRVTLVTDEEIDNPLFLNDNKAFLRKLPIPRRRMAAWLIEAGLRAEVELVTREGEPVEIDTELLDGEHIDLWFRDWIRMPERHVKSRVRIEARERIRLVTTLLRVIFPRESALWGRPLLPPYTILP